MTVFAPSALTGTGPAFSLAQAYPFTSGGAHSTAKRSCPNSLQKRKLQTGSVVSSFRATPSDLVSHSLEWPSERIEVAAWRDMPCHPGHGRRRQESDAVQIASSSSSSSCYYHARFPRPQKEALRFYQVHREASSNKRKQLWSLSSLTANSPAAHALLPAGSGSGFGKGRRIANCSHEQSDSKGYDRGWSCTSRGASCYLHKMMKGASNSGNLLGRGAGGHRSTFWNRAVGDGKLLDPPLASASAASQRKEEEEEEEKEERVESGKAVVVQRREGQKDVSQLGDGTADLQRRYYQGLEDSRRMWEESGEEQLSDGLSTAAKYGSNIGSSGRGSGSGSGSREGKREIDLRGTVELKVTPVGEMLTEWGAPAVEAHRELVEQLSDGYWQQGWEGDDFVWGNPKLLQESYKHLVAKASNVVSHKLLRVRNLLETKRGSRPSSLLSKCCEEQVTVVTPSWDADRERRASSATHVGTALSGTRIDLVGVDSGMDHVPCVGTAAKPAEWKKLIGMLFGVCLMCAIDRASMSVAQISMAKDLAYTDVAKGLVGSAFFFGYTFSQIAGGVLSARHGGRLVLGCALAWWSTCTLLTPLAAKHSLTSLLFTRMMLGLGEGVALPTVTGMLAQQVPLPARSRATAFVFSGTSLGTILCLYACPHIMALFGSWPWLFYVFGSAGIACAILWSMFAPPHSSSSHSHSRSHSHSSSLLVQSTPHASPPHPPPPPSSSSPLQHPHPHPHPYPQSDDAQLLDPTLHILPSHAFLVPSPSPSPSPSPPSSSLFPSPSPSPSPLPISEQWIGLPEHDPRLVGNLDRVTVGNDGIGDSGVVERGDMSMSMSRSGYGEGEVDLKTMQFSGFSAPRKMYTLNSRGQDSGVGALLPHSLDHSLMAGQVLLDGEGDGDGKREEMIPVREMESSRSKNLKVNEGDDHDDDDDDSDYVPWGAFLRAPAMWAIMGAHIASSWNHHLILVWLPTYLSTRLKLDLAGASMASVVPWIASFVALNMVGWIADWMFSTRLQRVQVRKMCQAIAFLGPAACLLRLVFCDDPSEAPFLLSSVLALSNFSAGGFFSNHPDLSQKHAGILFGITNTLGSIAGCMSIALTGVILDVTGGNWSYVWLSSAAIYIIATIWYALLASTERHFDRNDKLT